MGKSKHYKQWLIVFWVFCTISLTYQYGIRTSIPSVLNDNLLKYFLISAKDLGFLVSSSYFVYMCMQIPVGFLLDRCDNKIIAVLSCVFSSLSIILFVKTNIFQVAYLAQLFLGLSAAFAFPMIVKIAAECFSGKSMTLATSIALSFGALGPVAVGIVIAHFSEIHDWKSVIVGVGFFGFFIAVILLFTTYNLYKSDGFAVEYGITHSLSNTSYMKSQLKEIVFNKNFMLLCLYSMFLIGATAAFSDTWGIPFIKEMYDINRVQATSCIGMQFCGIVLGGPFFAYLVRIFNSFKKPMLFGALCVIVIFIIIIFIKVDFFILRILLFLLGVFGSSQTLTFLFALEIVSNKVGGLVTGVVNTITMLGSTITISLVGFLIYYSKIFLSKENDGYTVADYRFGLISLVVSAIISVVMMSCIQESNKKETNK